jgi:protoporphyrin/coproporphyrin ferrochelatase
MNVLNRPKGVLLLAFGGADSLEAVEPFMTNILGGRKPPSVLLDKMLDRYKLIGGKSPLPETTRQQAELVQKLLGEGYKVYVGMLHWHPFIKDAIAEAIQDGVKELVAVSLSPHFAAVTTGAYAKAIAKAQEEFSTTVEVKFAAGWFDHPLFIDGLNDQLQQGLEFFSAELRPQVEVILSAHSLPVAHIENGDPYVEQLDATVSALVAKSRVQNWHLAYQSKGGGQGEWLGPEVEEILDELAATGKKHVLVLPVGFAVDHIETLYDIEVAQRKHAEGLGLDFHRANALNTSAKFMQVLAQTAKAEF